MAVGKSGRLVIELDPEIKQKLHLAVKKSGLTMKEWFEQKAKSDFPEIFVEPSNEQ